MGVTASACNSVRQKDEVNPRTVQTILSIYFRLCFLSHCAGVQNRRCLSCPSRLQWPDLSGFSLLSSSAALASARARPISNPSRGPAEACLQAQRRRRQRPGTRCSLASPFVFVVYFSGSSLKFLFALFVGSCAHNSFCVFAFLPWFLSSVFPTAKRK